MSFILKNKPAASLEGFLSYSKSKVIPYNNNLSSVHKLSINRSTLLIAIAIDKFLPTKIVSGLQKAV